MEWIVPLVLATALVAPGLQRRLPQSAGLLLALVPAGVTAVAVTSLAAIAQGRHASSRSAWIPSLGIDWAFRVDGLANLLVLGVAGIGTLIVYLS